MEHSSKASRETYNIRNTFFILLAALLLAILSLFACTESPPATPTTNSGNGQDTLVKRNFSPIGVPPVGMSLLVLGSGGPDGADHERASAGYLVFVDGKAKALMDAGGGTYERIVKAGIDIRDLQYILFSHLHIDHTADLSAILKLLFFQHRNAGSQRTAPFHFYGPIMNGIPFPDTNIPQYPSTSHYIDQHYNALAGSERYLQFFAKAIGAGEFHYEAHDLPSDINAPPVVILDDDGLKIESIAVNHGPAPAVAYRLSYHNRSVVYSGDTTSASDNMITLSQNANIVLYDTAITDALPGDVISRLHTIPTRIGQVAVAANIKKLLLTHLTGTTLARLDEVKRSIRLQGFAGKIEEAEDLQLIR